MLGRAVLYTALVSGCLLAGRTRAADVDGAPPLAFEAALRVGIAAPFKLGRFGSAPIEAIAVAVPLRPELRARTAHLFVGAVAQYAFAGNDGECVEQASCSSHVLTAGPELLWFFDPSRLPNIWAGVSGGWQSSPRGGVFRVQCRLLLEDASRGVTTDPRWRGGSRAAPPSGGR